MEAQEPREERERRGPRHEEPRRAAFAQLEVGQIAAENLRDGRRNEEHARADHDAGLVTSAMPAAIAPAWASSKPGRSASRRSAAASAGRPVAGSAAARTVTLAVGITGTTVMFAMVDGVLLRPLPVRDQDRLILAWKELRSSRFAHYPFAGPDVEAVVEAGQLIESGAGVTSNGAVA